MLYRRGGNRRVKREDSLEPAADATDDRSVTEWTDSGSGRCVLSKGTAPGERSAIWRSGAVAPIPALKRSGDPGARERRDLRAGTRPRSAMTASATGCQP